jgi:hypothetical protein
LKSQITDLETEAARFKVGLAVCRTQLQDSQDAQVLAENEGKDWRTRNEQLLDQIRELKGMISKYEAQIELPLPSQIAIPGVEQQHSVIVCDLQLEVATYKSELEEIRAELKQALSDLEEARFPWYGMVLEADGEGDGQIEEGKKEAVDIVKAKIQNLETTITELQSNNGALHLQLDDIAAKAELKRLKDLAIKNARETTKLQILHAGSAVIDVTTPDPVSSTINDDEMEVEVEVEVEGECGCGREEVIKEMASRSEVVFEQTLILLENVRAAAQSKVEDAPLKDRAQSIRNVEILTRYMAKVEGFVGHAREGVANRQS